MSKQYTILSLDLSSNVGWAICRGDIIMYSGSQLFKKKDAHPGNTFTGFQNWLNDSFTGVNEICYEDVPRFESSAWARIYCGLLSVLQIFCLVHGIRLTCIKPNSVKKEFTGKGRCDKKAICKVAHSMGWKNGHPNTDLDHDEADAIAILTVMLSRRGVKARLYE